MTRGTTLREAFGSLGRCGSVSKVRVGEAITGLGRVETIGERCRLAGNILVGRNFGNLAGLPPGNFLVSCLLRTEKVTSGCYFLDISISTVMLEVYECLKPSFCISYMSPVSTPYSCRSGLSDSNFPFSSLFSFSFPFSFDLYLVSGSFAFCLCCPTRGSWIGGVVIHHVPCSLMKRRKKHDSGIIA